jgi:ATP-dependent helicase/nuclease subunit B
MRRWDMVVDDSAGAPFDTTSLGAYLCLCAEFLCNPDEPNRFLALLDHTLCRVAGVSVRANGEPLSKFADKALRGPRPTSITGQPFAGIANALTGALSGALNRALNDKRSDLDHLPDPTSLPEVVKTITDAVARWPSEATLSTYIRHLVETANAFSTATGPAESTEGELRRTNLWQGDAGSAGASALHELIDGNVDAVIRRHEFPATFAALTAGISVRPHARSHPRLSILGPLEARLMSADLVILGGLNEGGWPGDPGIDPFLSREMRRNLGLPSPERRIGLAAHDFAQLASPGRVLLTRSTKSGDGPTTPSRWIVRLKNLIKTNADQGSSTATAMLDRTDAYQAFADAFDAETLETSTPISRPAPRPPVEARPRRLSVTDVERWLRDPYGIYAKTILQLRKFSEPGEAFSTRELGSLLHKVFETAGHRTVPADLAYLWTKFDQYASEYGCGPTERAFWSGRVDRAFTRFVAYDQERRSEGSPAVIEGRGAFDLVDGGRPFEIHGIADRIDLQTNGNALIVDYKSSKPPGVREAKAFNPQLELLALIAEAGGFDALGGPVNVAGYEYFVFLANDGGRVSASATETDARREALDATRAKLAELAMAFDDPDTAYHSQPRPKFMDSFGDYDVLARRREWADAGTGGESGDGGA